MDTQVTEAVQAPIEEVSVHVPGSEGPMNARDAARSVLDWRRKRDAEPAVVDETKPATDSAQAETAPATEQSSGETEATDSATEELPPIEPPRSWTKDDKELFTSLPRATQERIAERERSRESDFLRRQNEATEQRKAMEAERGKVEQARQQYETALPALLQTLQDQQAGEFADIKTMADVENLARTDWPRYVLWDAQQKRIAAVQQQVVAATQRQNQERQSRLSEFMSREAELFAEKVPEIADPAQKSKLQEAAVTTLKEVGFSDQELGRLWRGEAEISLHDHRLQLLVRDGIRFREAQTKAKDATAKPVPPVQRPGASQPRGAAQNAVVQGLTAQLEKTGSLKDAARLLVERRKAAR